MSNLQSLFVPTENIFSNQFLEDLDRIWALRDDIPDPTNPFCTFKEETLLL